MLDLPNPTSNTVFLQIQNSKKPNQMISVIVSDSDGNFETQGLKELFALDEIRIDRNDFLLAMEEYAMVLSFLLETMSAGQDLNLPYSYMESFEYRGNQYSLTRQNGYRVLKRKE